MFAYEVRSRATKRHAAESLAGASGRPADDDEAQAKLAALAERLAAEVAEELDCEHVAVRIAGHGRYPHSSDDPDAPDPNGVRLTIDVGESAPPDDAE